jgi:hypothetical protein
MCCQSLILFGFNMIFSLSAVEDSTTLGGGIMSIEVLSMDVSTLGGGVLMVSGLSMIAVLIAVRSLTDLLKSFTLRAVCTSCGGLVASLKETFLVGVLFVVRMLLRSLSIFVNDSICSIPFMFLLPLRACVKSPRALMIISAGVTVG